ncbi:CDP-diacylglycerol--serine O-phosphatidyltransferase [Algoriphagus kandeliae]|uniref:CDP-diacylglycerol--serine O-phosphatidyltransferase n=1 Tax=Algoriphagus kandeliae TaxID=2562278 RepID=A0A4Y9QRG5_9BACT|nr:CDP-diacylglycerol--serine O-phosphatidyltransferase [Algoriphagus kandeliae]TFV94398.1 CDP-diacylglycerol--serine O-phosphatidyltransferase [Algoriphagus kandeliae]
MKIKSHIPNILTLGNLLSGVIGCIWVIEGNYQAGAYFILLAALLDFFDGFAARLLKVTGELGKQLDSLADLVSFGVLPGFILVSWIQNLTSTEWLAYLALTIPLFSALRLAKFNIDERQSDRFIGLPTPANALFFSTLPFLSSQLAQLDFLFANPWFLIVLAWIFSLLLVAELPLIALKFKNFSARDNVFRYMLIGSGAILLLTMGLAGVPLVILFYLVLSVIENSVFSP